MGGYEAGYNSIVGRKCRLRRNKYARLIELAVTYDQLIFFAAWGSPTELYMYELKREETSRKQRTHPARKTEYDWFENLSVTSLSPAGIEKSSPLAVVRGNHGFFVLYRI